MRRALLVACACSVLLGLGCHEEGAAEKAGRKLDETVDKLRHPNEGTLERLGRKTDEALDEAKKTVEDATRSDEK